MVSVGKRSIEMTSITEYTTISSQIFLQTASPGSEQESDQTEYLYNARSPASETYDKYISGSPGRCLYKGFKPNSLTKKSSNAYTPDSPPNEDSNVGISVFKEGGGNFFRFTLKAFITSE